MNFYIEDTKSNSNDFFVIIFVIKICVVFKSKIETKALRDSFRKGI
jgi:hypothetical protein